MKKKTNNALLGYENKKTGERSGVYLDITNGREYLLHPPKNKTLVKTDQRYHIYYFATEEDFDQWQKKRVAK